MRLQVREKRFESAPQALLSSLELSLDDGEFVALLGPSGVGKTTLLRIIAGLDAVYEGGIEPPVHAGAKAGVGFMFQEPRLMPWLTALENVALVCRGDRARAREALSAVGMHDALSHFPAQLSGGMQRRVALARAFAQAPRLLLMDEPFVSLDQPSAERMRELLLARWAELRPTVLFVSHNLEEAIALADRLVFLGDRPGRVILERPVSLQRPRSMNDDAVAGFRRELLASHPELLAGSAQVTRQEGSQGGACSLPRGALGPPTS